jgi:hypothetical protein
LELKWQVNTLGIYPPLPVDHSRSWSSKTVEVGLRLLLDFNIVIQD